MSVEAHQAQLEALLRHPSLWRGRGAAGTQAFSTGFPALDAVLPSGGWPRQGLVEIITTGNGHGELGLWTPLVRALTQADEARHCAFIAPPFELFAPAWHAAGVRLDRLLVTRESTQAGNGTDRATESFWALEQSLQSGACSLCIAWQDRASLTQLRRLALAAGRGAALGVLIRPLRALAMPTAAVLRLTLRRTATHLRLELVKGRGIGPRSIELALP
jgi:cell division inhibitor SulA/protein ImuA